MNLSGLDLHPPVTFRLKHGSGPVYVGAEHVAREGRLLLFVIFIVYIYCLWLGKCFLVEEFSDDEEMDDEVDEEEVEEEEEDIEESPVKKVTKNGAGKVRSASTHKSHF